MPNMGNKMKAVANGGGGPGVVTKTTNPGSANQAVGKPGKHANNTEPGTAPMGTEITFSSHPGHGSAARTIRSK